MKKHYIGDGKQGRYIHVGKNWQYLIIKPIKKVKANEKNKRTNIKRNKAR